MIHIKDLKELASGNIAEEMKYFIQDFILNNKEFDNVSCMIMDSKKDVLHVGDVVFYLLGEKNIWFINLYVKKSFKCGGFCDTTG